MPPPRFWLCCYRDRNGCWLRDGAELAWGLNSCGTGVNPWRRGSLAVGFCQAQLLCKPPPPLFADNYADSTVSPSPTLHFILCGLFRSIAMTWTKISSRVSLDLMKPYAFLHETMGRSRALVDSFLYLSWQICPACAGAVLWPFRSKPVRGIHFPSQSEWLQRAGCSQRENFSGLRSSSVQKLRSFGSTFGRLLVLSGS